MRCLVRNASTERPAGTTSVPAHVSYRRGPSKNSQSANGWVDEGTSALGQEEGEDDLRHRKAGVEAALAQGIASSLRTLVIASFRAPPNKFVLGEANKEGKGSRTLDDILQENTERRRGRAYSHNEPYTTNCGMGKTGKIIVAFGRSRCRCMLRS